MDCFGTYLTHAQSCDNVRVHSATQWTASVHTLHMPKAVLTFMFKVLQEGLRRYIHMPKAVITFVFKVLRNGLCFRRFRVFAVFAFSRFRFLPFPCLAFSRFRVFVLRRRHPRSRDTDFVCTAQSGRFKVHTPCSSNTSSTSSQSVWGRQLFLYVWVVRLLTCVCHEQQWFAVVFKYWPTDWIARGCGLTFWPAIFAVTLHMDGGAQASGSELALCRLRVFPFYFSVFACPARSWCLLVLGIAGESVGRLWSVFFCILSTWILRNLRPAHEFYAHHFTQIAEAQNSQGQSAQNLHNPTAHDFFGTIKPWHSAKHLGILKFKYACYTCIFYMFMICMYIFMYTHFLMYTHFFICKDMFTVYLFIYLFIYTCRCLNT